MQEVLYEATGQADYFTASFGQAAKAVSLDPFAPSTRAFRGALAERHGNADLALSEYEEALRLHPCEPRRYEVVAEFRLSRVKDALRRGDTSAARSELENLLALRDRLATQSAAVPAYAPAARLEGDAREAAHYLELARYGISDHFRRLPWLTAP